MNTHVCILLPRPEVRLRPVHSSNGILDSSLTWPAQTSETLIIGFSGSSCVSYTVRKKRTGLNVYITAK